MQVTAAAKFNAIEITINGLLHLYIDRQRLLGIHSWEHQGKYCIEFTMAGGRITAEYDTATKWHAVLKQLHKATNGTDTDSQWSGWAQR